MKYRSQSILLAPFKDGSLTHLGQMGPFGDTHFHVQLRCRGQDQPSMKIGKCSCCYKCRDEMKETNKSGFWPF